MSYRGWHHLNYMAREQWESARIAAKRSGRKFCLIIRVGRAPKGWTMVEGGSEQ